MFCSSIWFFCSEEKTNITAVNIFERTHNKHYKDITLVPAVHGRYFRALLTEEKHEQLPVKILFATTLISISCLMAG